MRTLLLIAALAVWPIHGEEPRPAQALPLSPMSEKAHALILESLPPPAPAQPTPIRQSDADVIMLHPLIVRETYLPRGLDDAMRRQRERDAAEHFSMVKGGTLFHTASGKTSVGSWYTPDQGWSFLKFKW